MYEYWTPDRELLQIAAAAAGYALGKSTQNEWDFTCGGRVWNPLSDDGDAFRLAVALRIDLQSFAPEGVRAIVDRLGLALGETCPLDGDRCAATRRAIVRAAAAGAHSAWADTVQG
jgi:hypothetical protein